MVKELGIQIPKAVSVLAEVTKQADALREFVARQLSDRLGRDERCQAFEANTHESEEWHGDAWVRSEHMMNYGIKRARKKSLGDERIALDISLTGEPLTVGGEPEALFYVHYSSDGDWEYESEGLFRIHSAKKTGYVCRGRLWCWEGHKLKDGSDWRYWSFAVPLVSLNNSDDVERNIVRPICRLLSVLPEEELTDETIVDAFGRADSVLRFE